MIGIWLTVIYSLINITYTLIDAWYKVVSSWNLLPQSLLLSVKYTEQTKMFAWVNGFFCKRSYSSSVIFSLKHDDRYEVIHAIPAHVLIVTVESLHQFDKTHAYYSTIAAVSWSGRTTDMKSKLVFTYILSYACIFFITFICWRAYEQIKTT